MQVREKIEAEGREPRWEFSKTVLFERSAHISDVCGSLTAAVDTYHSLRQTLGPRLEAMTGSSQVAAPAVCLAHLLRATGAVGVSKQCGLLSLEQCT